MKAVIQRVKNASVIADGVPTGEIGQGFAVLLGVEQNDSESDAEVLADKIWGLRVFTDENDKMNLSLQAIGGQVLVVSNFTLAAPPDEANRLYEYFMLCLKNAGVSKLACGVFGADMQLDITNDGPVTIILDSRELKKKCLLF